MTNFEEYKTKLIEEIKDLPDGSRILVLASCPGGDADETDNVEYATALHGSLEDMMRLMSNGLEETLVSCQLTPTEGAMFCSILLHELKLAGSRAGMRVLRCLTGCLCFRAECWCGSSSSGRRVVKSQPYSSTGTSSFGRLGSTSRSAGQRKTPRR